MSRPYPISGGLFPKSPCAMPLRSAQSWLKTSPNLKPLPPCVMCGHLCELCFLNHAGSFYDTHWFLTIPHPSHWVKDLNWELILIIISPNPPAAPAVTDLQKGQRNYLPRVSVSSIWLLPLTLICEFDEFFNTSAWSFCSVHGFSFSSSFLAGSRLHSCLAGAPTVQLILWTCSQMGSFQRSASFGKLG